MRQDLLASGPRLPKGSDTCTELCDRGTGCLAAGLAGGLLAAPAAAAPIERDHFDAHSVEVEEDFCEIEGFDVVVERHEKGHFLLVQRGRDRLAYGMSTVRSTTTFTNPTTGKTVTFVSSVLDKDLKVTDNGDGTLTVLVLATGGERIFLGDELVLHNPGQVRFTVLIDNGGTPTNPLDDEFIDFIEEIKSSTGRNDTEGRDFCEDFLRYTA